MLDGDARDLVGQRLDEVVRGALDIGDDPLGQAAVVERVGDVVALAGVPGVDRQLQADQDVLRLVALPVVDADDATQQQILDQDAVGGAQGGTSGSRELELESKRPAGGGARVVTDGVQN